MTAVDDTPDTARAADLDCLREAWRVYPIHQRPASFGKFAVDFLRERGLELVPTGAPQPFPGEQLKTLFPNLPDNPHVRRALGMSIEEIADLLAALAERGLHWTAGEPGRCGTLHEGAPEPPDLHVVFDCWRAAWQRDDSRACDEGDPCQHWFGPLHTRRTWTELQHINGPLTPDGGIAPPTRSEP